MRRTTVLLAMSLPTYHQSCSCTLIGMCKMSLVGVFETLFTAVGFSFEHGIVVHHFARDCARLHTAARQQVSLAFRTSWPIFLRQIPQNHNRIEARTPFKPILRPCRFLTHVCLRLVCSAVGGAAESTPPRGLRAFYSTESDDSGRDHWLLCDLRTIH